MRNCWLFLCLILFSCNEIKSSVDGREVLMNVNGYGITTDEFSAQMSRNKAGVVDYFQKKYQVGYPSDFWGNNYHDESPMKMLLDSTIKQLVEIRLKKQLAYEKGIIENPDYSTFLTSFEEENNKRRLATERKTPVYGPVKLSLPMYQSYYMTILENETRRVLKASYAFKMNELRKSVRIEIDQAAMGKLTIQ